jgi:LPXTG-motif cell wall-anchored protein
MLKKVVALVAMVLLVGATAAGAQEYPPAGDTVTVSDTTVEPGEPITVNAQVYQPSSTVTFTFFSEPVMLGTDTANGSGVASLTATIPANATPGTHRIDATGTGADGQPLTVSVNVTVLGATAGSNLPTTGSGSTAPLTQMAVAALAGGGLLVLLANRRRAERSQVRETAGV